MTDSNSVWPVDAIKGQGNEFLAGSSFVTQMSNNCSLRNIFVSELLIWMTENQDIPALLHMVVITLHRIHFNLETYY